jgi:pSer/pThr/pTyr-binding forkhead associated (FHA) protein
MGAKLIGRTGVVAGKDYAVAGTVLIGSGREADVRVRTDMVSRVHARLWQEGDNYYLEDAGSTNGTFLSGIGIRKDRVRHLDIVTLGRSVDLIFVVRDEESGAAAPVQPCGIISATLEPLDGPEAGTPIEIPKGETTFGRADSNNIVIESRAVSTVHARLERTTEIVRLQDLGSVNGTFVNDTRIDAPVVLGRGDRISLAGVRTFQVTVERAGEAQGESAGTSLPSIGPIFSQEWKTRLVWSAEELAELAQMSEPTPEAPPESKKPAARRPAVAAAKKQAGATKKAKQEPPPADVAPKSTPESAPGPVSPPPQVALLPPRVRLVGATTHTLALGTTTVGRDVAASLSLPVEDRVASRIHAEIIVTADEVAIEDKGSVNGTQVNDREIRSRQRLASGDRIKIGETEWTVEIS